jgi:tetratricopeptide (TPR) repeat protein
MFRRLFLLALIASFAVLAAHAQSAPTPDQPNQAPPRSDDRTPGESSSKDTRIDLSPPAGDAKMHPNSGVADDVLELRPYDPHRAEKNIEVGDYYFKLKNYPAAESRYEEALEFKPNDAEATFKLGVAQEIQGKSEEALDSFQSYLKILPEGPHAEESKVAIERIKNPEAIKPKAESKREKKKKEKSK